MNCTKFLFLLSALVTVSSGLSAQCPPDSLSGAGEATKYSPANETNVCSLTLDGDFNVALPPSLWEGSSRCGECLEVIGPEGSVVVQVVDYCPDCPADRLDLSVEAFDAISNVVSGTIDISWKRVECDVTGPAQFRFLGSNPFFLNIQAKNIRHGVSGMAYRDGDAWVDMTRSEMNRFEGSPDNNSNVEIQATAITGDAIEVLLGDPSQSDWIDGPRQFASCINEVFDDGFEAPESE